MKDVSSSHSVPCVAPVNLVTIRAAGSKFGHQQSWQSLASDIVSSGPAAASQLSRTRFRSEKLSTCKSSTESRGTGSVPSSYPPSPLSVWSPPEQNALGPSPGSILHRPARHAQDVTAKDYDSDRDVILRQGERRSKLLRMISHPTHLSSSSTWIVRGLKAL
eukprot:767586-Hanusia_phi.AAC.5